MSKGNEPAYPVKKRVLDQCASMQQRKEVFADVVSGGLTKRELFAAMAMQSLISERCYPIDPNMPRYAVAAADALLAELERRA